VDKESTVSKASPEFRFAAAVAQFGMILRDSPYKGNSTLAHVQDTPQGSKGQDRNGYREEFIQLVRKARPLGR